MKLLLAITLAVLAPASPAAQAEPAPPRDVSDILAPIVRKHGVPGMAAAVVQNGEVVAIGAAGVRTSGKSDAITTADLFHLGSDTKAMTAMLCGVLVDEGKLRWDQTLGETFPDLKESMHAQYRGVTLEQLLTHHGGAPADLNRDGLWARLWTHRGTPTQARGVLLRGVTSHPPQAPPGTAFIYSNAGYAIAGHMAEQATSRAWEDLMREKVFRPLGMTTAGFGAPGVSTSNDQPRGHGADGSPVEPGPDADNPAAIGPAGTVHCSVGDWAKFAAANLPSAKVTLVKPETLRKLHTPAPGTPPYAMGWIVVDNAPGASGGVALTHAGSNTMWFASAWLAPAKDLAVLVACNRAHEKACREAFHLLMANLAVAELRRKGTPPDNE